VRVLRSLLPALYPVFSAGTSLRKAFGIPAAPRLRVALFHDVAPDEIPLFAAQMMWLQQSWTFASPDLFQRLMRGEVELEADTLVLTFDDGFASNRRVAEEVLRPLGIRALFFVATDFIAQPDPEAARRFIVNRLKIGGSVEELPRHMTNMTWEDLSALNAMGHVIGSHTASHARLGPELSSAELMHEVVVGADRLEDRLNVPVRHFAFPFGNIDSFSMEAMAISARRFDFVYSGLRGDNHPATSPCAIRRDSLSPTDGRHLVGAFLAGAADLRYQRSNALLDRWAASSAEQLPA